jgi:hypothetical protein
MHGPEIQHDRVIFGLLYGGLGRLDQSLSTFYLGETLEIIFKSQETPA